MWGRVTLGSALIAIAVISAAPALGDDASERRGGNHGCDPSEGTFYSSHFWEAGDKITFGFAFRPGSALPPGTSDSHVMRAKSRSRSGEGPSNISCQDDVNGWMSLTSDLGPGDDVVRFDAKGLETEKGQEPYRPLTKRMDTTVTGGSGNDLIRGHKGFDNIRAGSGKDVIKADDGVADNVNCGTGKDKADVDRKDDVANCEKLT